MRNCVTIVRPAASAGARRGQRGQLDGVPLTALLASTLGALINWENTPSKEAGDNNITDTFISYQGLLAYLTAFYDNKVAPLH